MRLYAIQVDIFEAAREGETPASLSPASRARSASRTRSLGYAYPVVRHQFLGKDRAEAVRYHDSHRQSDRFIRECEDKGMFETSASLSPPASRGTRPAGAGTLVACRAVITEG